MLTRSEVNERRGGVKIRCPLPEHYDSNPSAMVYEDGSVYCFACRKYISPSDAKILGVKRKTGVKKNKVDKVPIEVLKDIELGKVPDMMLYQIGERLLIDDVGFVLEVLKEYCGATGFGYVWNGKYRGRLAFIEYYPGDKEIKAIQYRRMLGDTGKKSIYGSGSDCDRGYRLNEIVEHCREKQIKYIIFVEGVFDYLAVRCMLSMYRYDEVVACTYCYGMAYKEILEVCVQEGLEVICGFDNDKKGWELYEVMNSLVTYEMKRLVPSHGIKDFGYQYSVEDFRMDCVRAGLLVFNSDEF